MSTKRYITRLVNLEPLDHQTILKNAFNKGFGEAGFSASLRSILREWSVMRAVFSSLPSKEKQLFAKLANGIYQTVSQEDEFLESGTLEIEYPSDTSEPTQTTMPKLPENEYEANLYRVRAWKYLRPKE